MTLSTVTVTGTWVKPGGPALNSNTGFESGVAPWTINGSTSVVQSSAQARSGTYSAQITPNGTSVQSYLSSEQVPVTPGQTVVGTAWGWFTNAVTSNYHVNFDWSDASHHYLSTTGFGGISASAGTWTQTTATATAPAGAAYVSMSVVLGGTPAASQIWFVDDASFSLGMVPASGQVVFTPLGEAIGGGQMVAAEPVVVPLVGGAISTTLVSNAQASTMQYLVTEQISGAPTVSYVIVPSGTSIDLSTAPRITTGMSGAMPNPNRPVVTVDADFTQGPPNLPGAKLMSLNAPARRNAVRKIDIQRGRQYELDQVQSGTLTLDITDPLELLHPANVPGAGNLAPNPTFSTLNGWSGSGSATLTLVSGGSPGQTSARVTATQTSTASGIATSANITGITGGAQYNFAGDVNPGQAITVTFNVDWYAGTSLLSTTSVVVGQPPVGQWSTYTTLHTAPASATAAVLRIDGGVMPVAAIFAVDNVALWLATNPRPAPGSPFNTNGNTITSYRAAQVGAFWNPATGSWSGNVLNPQNQAPGQPDIGVSYGYDPGFEGWNLGVAVPSSDGSTQNSVTSPADGTHPVTQVILASSSSTYTYGLRAVPGQSYKVTVDVYATPGVTVTASYGAATVSTTSSGAYQTLTLGPFTAVAGGNVVFTATGGYPATFYISNVLVTGPAPGWTGSSGSTMIVTTAQAHSGTYSLQATLSGRTDSVSLTMRTAPGITYTMSSWVYAPGTGTVATMTVAGSTVTTTTTNTWQRLNVTFVAADAVTSVAWDCPATTTFPGRIYIDDIQLEIGPAASSYTTSGPTWYPLWTGYIERYPLQWDMSGTRGIRPLTGVDALSVLSRTEITQSYSSTILADNPTVYVPYDDASAPQAVQLPQGGQPMIGYTQLGASSGAVNFGGDTFLDGTSAVSVVQQNTDPVTFRDPTSNLWTYSGTRQGQISLNTQSYTYEVWVKFTKGVVYFGLGAMQPGESTINEPIAPRSFVGFYTFNGVLVTWGIDQAGVQFMYHNFSTANIAPFPDGQWHLWVIRALGNNQFDFRRDLTSTPARNYGGTPQAVMAINNVFAEASAYHGDPVSNMSVANVAVYPTALSNTQLAAHYQRGVGYLGEVSGSRVSRLLAQYWGGPTTVAAGKRQMSPDFDYNARFVLDVLQEIQETERGLLYADRAGFVVFEDSTTRAAKNLTSLWTFGENPAGASPAEYPYTALVQDFDPTYTFSQTNLTRPANSNYPPQINATAASNYGQRILTQQVMVNSDYDLGQASQFYLARYSQPRLRVETLTLNPAANPALWPVVLGLEVSQRITVKRRTSAGLTTSTDYYVEQINHQIDGPASAWTVNIQCSPVFSSNGWVLGDATYGVLGSTTIPVY